MIIEKERILNKDFNIFSEQIKEMDEGIHSVMRNNKLNVNFNIEWLNKFKNLFSIKKEELIAIPPEKRIETLEKLLESKRKDLGILKQQVDEKQRILLNDIDEELQYYREQLIRINEELEKTKNPVKRFFKKREKGSIENKKAE